MSTRADQSPTFFPTAPFVIVGAAWALLDVVVLLYFTLGAFSIVPRFDWSSYGEYLFIAWQAILAAKAMLMLGWWFLGEGQLGHRLAGAALFLPVFVPVMVAAYFEPELLCVLMTMAVFAVPVLFMVGLPYVVLKATDHRLARDAPASTEKVGQFTVRQLMLVTLIAAIVLGLLRWAEQSQMSWAVVGLQAPLLIWIYPFVMCRGLLQPRWYPDVLFAIGVTAFVLALPSFALSDEEVFRPALFVGTYTFVFTCHLLLLRWLGFRLVQYQPRFRYDPGISFIDQHEPGIVFLERNG